MSSDPVQVCMCNNGHQLCNESYAEIIAYPGETFTLTVVVGADFGVTIGSVHTVFENPITTIQLKPSSQYMYKECAQLMMEYAQRYTIPYSLRIHMKCFSLQLSKSLGMLLQNSNPILTDTMMKCAQILKTIF